MISIIFIFLLVILYFGEHMGIDPVSFDYITITGSPVLLLLGALLLLGLLSFVSGFLKVKKLFPALFLFQIPSFIWGTVWVLRCPFVPISDSQKVMDTAALIAEKADTSAFFAYFDMLPQQRSVTLFFSLFFAIFGAKTYLVVRLLNVVCACLAAIFLSLMAYEITEDTGSAMTVSLLLTLFFPLMAYSNLAYGTLPGICLVFAGFLSAIKLVKKPAISHILVVSIVFPAALFIYKGTLIADIAVILFLLIAFITSVKPNGLKKSLILMVPVIVIMLYILTSQAVIDALFIKFSGLKVGKGVSSLSWILMGLVSKDGVNGAGSYSFVIDRLYADYGSDSAAMNAYVKAELGKAIGKIFSDPAEAFVFFREKQKWQWTDSTFGSLKEGLSLYTDLSGGEDLGPFRMFLNSKFMKAIYLFLEVYLGAIIIAAITFFATMFKSKENKANYLQVLPMLYFLGGFAFQLIAEQKSRYCLPYFLMLILWSGILLYNISVKNERIRSLIKCPSRPSGSLF